MFRVVRPVSRVKLCATWLQSRLLSRVGPRLTLVRHPRPPTLFRRSDVSKASGLSTLKRANSTLFRLLKTVPSLLNRARAMPPSVKFTTPP